ncbi:Low-affinity gluconate transporter [bacterium HR18]|nr:Low-affinity gluconate transporter [bacterium HR18]
MSTVALTGLALLAVAVLLLLVLWMRVHAFVALMLTSLLTALLGGIPADRIADVLREGMGSTLGYIAVVIGLGAMIGEMLQQSGGTARIAQSLLKRFGEHRAPWALALTGFLVAIPVFFDVALILLLPLVYSLAHRTGRSLLYYALPLAAGIAVAHSFIPPTPGPVAVAGLLGADLGWVILFGVITGLPATIVGGIWFGRWMAGRLHVPVPLHLFAEPAAPEQPMPSFGQAVGVILLPLGLILLGTAASAFLPQEHMLRPWLRLLGHPFTALVLGTLWTFYVLGLRLGYPMRTVQQCATKALEPTGLILLVTGAGGVLSRVLVETGVGQAMAEALAATRLPVIVLAFGIALAVRIAQGSATVSMVTAAGLIAPLLQAGTYAQPMLALVTLAIAAGATACSHVNDSGFWLISRYLDLSEADTLRVWTVLETILGLSGLAAALLLSLWV